MKNGILNELISTMRERIPQDMNLANTLADILCMGKEGVIFTSQPASLRKM